MRPVQDLSRPGPEGECPFQNSQLAVDLGVGCTGFLPSQDEPLDIGSRDRSCTATAEKREDVLAYAALDVAQGLFPVDPVIGNVSLPTNPSALDSVHLCKAGPSDAVSGLAETWPIGSNRESFVQNGGVARHDDPHCGTVLQVMESRRSGCASLVAMMKPTDFWDFNDPTHVGRLDFPGLW
jgi:hypothetical protein